MNKRALPHFPASFFGTKELGCLIRNTRKARGMKQSDLAIQTNTSRCFISEVENGKETAQVGKIFLLLRLLDLGVQLVDLRQAGEVKKTEHA